MLPLILMVLSQIHYFKNKNMIKLRHIGIAVKDMEKSLELYKNIFGLEVVWNEIESSTFIDRLSNIDDVKVHTVKLKDNNGGMIELLQYLSHPEKINNDPINRIGCSHIAITVENIDNMYKKLSDHGLTFHNPPEKHPEDWVKAKVAFCRDENGVLIEVVEELK